MTTARGGTRPMRPPLRRVLFALAVVAVLYAAFAAFVTWPQAGAKTATIVAGTAEDGTMYYRCVAAESTAGVCREAQPARVVVGKRDRLTFRVRTDDGKRRSHDFLLEGGAAYLLPPARVETELEKPEETVSFTAWKAGEYRFICELPGHARAGMVGTLAVEG